MPNVRCSVLGVVVNYSCQHMLCIVDCTNVHMLSTTGLTGVYPCIPQSVNRLNVVSG